MIPKEHFRRTRNLLVRGLNWIGDAVMSLPTLWALRDNLPDTKISVLSPGWCAGIYEICPAVDAVLVPVKGNGPFGKMRAELHTAGELGRLGFDAAIILPNSFRSAVAPFVAGIPQRYGYRTDGRTALLTDGLPKSHVPVGHTVLYYRPLLEELGVPWPEGVERFDLDIDEQTRDEADEILKKHGVDTNAQLIGFSPGAAWGPSKRWPVERFAEATSLLMETQGRQAVFFGSGGDNELINGIIEKLNVPAASLAGAFEELRHLVAVIDRCSILITNDSGPMHIAAARRVPIVAMFGPTDERISGPWTGAHGKARILRPTDCEPCYNPECQKGAEPCLARISAEEAAAAAEELISASEQGL